MRNAVQGNASSKSVPEERTEHIDSSRIVRSSRSQLWFQLRRIGSPARKTDYGRFVIAIALRHTLKIMRLSRRRTSGGGRRWRSRIFHGTSKQIPGASDSCPPVPRPRGNSARRKRGSRRAKSVRLFAASSPT